MKPSKTQAQPPDKHTGLTKKPVPETAVGLPAITSALKHVQNEMDWDTGFKTLNSLNQINGVDCPGCAWPDPKVRSKLGEYCENGVKAISEEATNKKIGADFFAKHSVTELSHWSDFEIGKSGRLTKPMVIKKGSDHYEPIEWQQAFEMIGSKLKSLPDPNQAIFYTSGRTSNEAAFLYQLFVRMYGTNNLPDCSNMCHESSGKALSETLGIGKGSVTLEDFDLADLTIVIGQNPGTNHPRMLSALQRNKKRGGKIITINPLPETGLMRFKHPQNPLEWIGSGTQLTDLFLQVRINGDVPLLKAIMKLMLIEENKNPGSVFDHEFIQTKTSGFDEFLEALDSENLDDLINQTSIEQSQIEEATALIINSKKVIVCWAMGLTQHQNAVDNIREIVNLLLLKGSIGKPGAGTCPVRGHSNVQGDRTMGIWEAPPQAFLDKIETVFEFKPPQNHGYNTVEAIEAMHNGKAKVFFGMGGNFLSATPDTEFTAKALQRCELTVHVSTKLNRSHLIHGEEALILPCLGRTEIDQQAFGGQFVSVENSMGMVHSSKGVIKPASNDLLSEPKIVAEIAKATLTESKLNWDGLISNYDLIRDLIEKTIPGFDSYNERVRQPGGFYLPNGAREGTFKTSDQKAQFTINNSPTDSLTEEEFLMTTIRSHDQFNTTIYGLDDRYRGIYNERRVVLMNADDMAESSLKENDIVDLESHYGLKRTARKFIVVSYNIPRKCVATYFPEANVLVPIDHKAHTSDTPASKSVKVKIVKTFT
ncbi:MAG: FdhF/YdeP family oxidoreductase [Cyclobacteriaceae bacterium]